MKISLIGYGKMGRVVEEVALKEGIKVVSKIDPTDEEATHKEINEEALKEANVVIDFSSPKAVLKNVKKVASLKKNMVIGTTGWYENINIVKKIVYENNIGVIYSPNFSIGVNILFKILEETLKIFNKAKWYDIYIYEGHHNQKIDSPSGTAKQIGNLVLKNIERKRKILAEVINRKINPDEIHIASFRSGYIVGLHVIGFDSEFDNIEIKHVSKNRKGFAIGALIAAKWIMKRKGFFSFYDIFSEILK